MTSRLVAASLALLAGLLAQGCAHKCHRPSVVSASPICPPPPPPPCPGPPGTVPAQTYIPAPPPGTFGP